MPKISIIVPVYNVEKYLSKCLDSLVNQTIDDFEIIIVNDGSPDRSQAIIDDYSKRFPKLIKSFSKENGGLSDARNFGIKKANGEYIGFVDSDDYVKTYMFEKMYNEAKAKNADVVYSPLLYLKDFKGTRTYFRERVMNNSNILKDPFILYDANSYACNKIYKKSFWNQYNFEFQNQAFEDSALIYNVLLCAKTISCCNDPMYIYNQKRENAITTVIDEKIFDIFKSVNSIVNFYKNQLGELYSDYQPYLAFVCIKHLLVRIKHIKNYADNNLKKRFLKDTFYFIDTNFPNFQNYNNHNEIIKLISKTIYSKCTYKNYKKRIAEFLTANPIPALSKKTFNKRNLKKIKLRKQKYIQKNGLMVLIHIQEMLDSLGITNFADFGTLLGLIREGNLLKHDLDMDIGVIAKENQKDTLRLLFEKNGYKLWRSYTFDNKTVEDSFKFKGIKIDINYYEQTDTQSKTWLFYKKPDAKYKNNFERNVVEMKYSKIKSTQKIKIDGYDINIPINPETLLKEKYGKNWRTPDTKWIYWLSPAATPIEEIGTFITYDYKNFPYQRIPKEEPFDIKHLQELELSILKEVARICEENNLTYYLGEGTLLGAIRHKGFIPWDDDIDIVMPREDYEKFIEIAPNIIGDNYEVQHYKLCKNYWSIFMKIRLKNNSVYYQSTLSHLTKNNGPYIDIFPLEKIGDVPLKKLKQNKKQLSVFRKILSYKLKETFPKTKKTMLIYPRIFFNSLTGIYKNAEILYHNFDDENGENYINFASYYDVSKQIFPTDYYGEPIKAEFCGYEFNIPVKYHKILSTIYGDYMTLPLPKKRCIKHSFIQKTPAKKLE